MKKLVFTSICLLLAIPCYARIITVDDDSPADFNTIQAAIDDANDGDVVEVQPGTYTGLGNRDIDFLGKAITVRSTDSNDPNIVAATIIDCTNSGRGFYFNNGETQTSVLEGLTIKRGKHIEHKKDAFGGAIYCEDSSPFITNCIFTGNTVRSSRQHALGGAIYCVNSSITVANCIFNNNIADPRTLPSFGGGIYCAGFSSQPLIINCSFVGNQASGGGGICCASRYYSTYCKPIIRNCVFEGNGTGIRPYFVPSRYGGGIYCTGLRNQPRVENCSFIGNKAKYGGGIAHGPDSSYGELIVDNCIFENNTALSSSGGVFSSSVTRPIENIFTNCSFIGNEAKYGGSFGSFGNVQSIIGNCVFRDNIASSSYLGGGAIVNEQSNGLVLTNCILVDNMILNQSGYGTGIWNIRSPLNLTNCTLAGNRGYYPSTSHTIYNLDYGDINIYNCVIWNDYPISGNLSSVQVNYSNIKKGWVGEGNIDADPCFVKPGCWGDVNDPNIIVPPDDPNAIWVNGDYHLLPDSLCIDVGDPNYISKPNETDLDGNPRIFGGRIDTGAYEFSNNEPIADAGPDQTIYVCNDEVAEVILDGSGSYDEDGDPLSYLWTWTIDSNAYDTNGVTPSIELPIGEHIIELVVNDGTVDSEPDEVIITVIGSSELLDILAEQVMVLELQPGVENSLLTKIDTALQKLEDKNQNNDIAAVNLLKAFINAVESQSGKKIPTEDADALITAAQQIIDLLNDCAVQQ
ncbi:MAG: choice-of-anchor Q domain-containing protein [Planctomycetota bacterium]|jgi:hypothetical protein